MKCERYNDLTFKVNKLMKEALISHILQLFFGVAFYNVCINPLKDAINNSLTFKTTRNAKRQNI